MPQLICTPCLGPLDYFGAALPALSGYVQAMPTQDILDEKNRSNLLKIPSLIPSPIPLPHNNPLPLLLRRPRHINHLPTIITHNEATILDGNIVDLLQSELLGRVIGVECGQAEAAFQGQGLVRSAGQFEKVVLAGVGGWGFEQIEQLVLGLLAVIEHNLLPISFEDIIGRTAHNLIISPILINPLHHEDSIGVLRVDLSAHQPRFVMLSILVLLHPDCLLVSTAHQHVVCAFLEACYWGTVVVHMGSRMIYWGLNAYN